MESNDPVAKSTKISVSGQVERFVTMTPRVVRFNGNVGEAMKETISIVPEAQYPFSIKKVRAHRGEFIKYELTESVSEEGKKRFSLTVENTKTDAGAYYDVIILETDSPIQPEMKLNVMARILDPKAAAAGKIKGNKSPSKEKTLGSSDNAKGDSATGAANFLEVIQQLQKQQKIKGSDGVQPLQQDPERAAALKKKFETLIKEAQQRQQETKATSVAPTSAPTEKE